MVAIDNNDENEGYNGAEEGSGTHPVGKITLTLGVSAQIYDTLAIMAATLGFASAEEYAIHLLGQGY